MRQAYGAILAALLLAAGAAPAVAVAAPARPFYRDPVHDGAADPVIVRDRRHGEWVMFYTNRRADLPREDERDVRWVHGTAIGVARSADGAHWRYEGTAAIPPACTGATLWAPEVQWLAGRWHMWLTVVPGVFRDWNAPRFIVHLTSDDLKQWQCGERLDLGSDRVIDASVNALPGGGWRLYFNDERQNKAIRQADSDDLVHWRLGPRLTETPGEGPKAFRWRGRWWLVSDAWKGLLVMSSRDGERWSTQPDYLLADAGRDPTDRAKGQHPDVVVSGKRAWIVYFVHQSGEDEARRDPEWGRRSVLQIAELHRRGDALVADRTTPTALPRP
ncbi:glycoside hydrolase family 43 [Novosphingobium resinovorum]|uniref:glycoside hydrolase family 43 n=1 Tax=Novosphingobium resinovorum TaxID=158500 RepID=UPI002ED0B30E|nr:glycoside hydrolase family 43 [Novosphingobium resinovorum]